MIDHLRYDTFSRRFFAGLLDGVVLLPVNLLALVVFFSSNVFVISSVLVILYSFPFVYSVWFHAATGQTLGKKWMGVRVVDSSERKLLTFEQSLKRDSIYIILQTTGMVAVVFQVAQLGHFPPKTAFDDILDWAGLMWFVLEIVTMFMNSRRRAVHDLLAGSVVIREEYWEGRAAAR